MAKTNKIVYVTQAQYESLITDGYVEVGGVTYNYDANNTYMVQENGIEGTAILSTGVTGGKVLTANGVDGASWQTISHTPEGTAVKSTGVTSGKVLTANGSGAASWQTVSAGAPEGTAVKSTGVTSGKVLTANGSGGATWETSSGSGDVTASGTLSVGSVILGLGGKSVTAASGTNGKFLGWNGGAAWQGLYLHTIHVTRTQNPNTPVEMYFSVISTQSAAYTSMSNVPNGFYVASGNANESGFNEGQCRILYYDRSHDTIGYWKATSNALATQNLGWSQTSVSITDTVSQIS